MKAILINDNQQLYIGETAKPAFMKNELLVKVHATALNRADLLQKRGLYPPPEGASTILGLKMSGIIEDGDLKPVIDSVWDWKDANEAHAYMEQNKNAGKIVLRVNENIGI